MAFTYFKSRWAHRTKSNVQGVKSKIFYTLPFFILHFAFSLFTAHYSLTLRPGGSDISLTSILSLSTRTG